LFPIPIFSPCGAALHEIFATPLDRQLLRLHELDPSASDVVMT
jgi:hypothetical protein